MSDDQYLPETWWCRNSLKFSLFQYCNERRQTELNKCRTRALLRWGNLSTLAVSQTYLQVVYCWLVTNRSIKLWSLTFVTQLRRVNCPTKEQAPRDRRNWRIKRCVDSVELVVVEAHTGWSEDGHKESNSHHKPPKVQLRSGESSGFVSSQNVAQNYSDGVNCESVRRQNVHKAGNLIKLWNTEMWMKKVSLLFSRVFNSHTQVQTKRKPSCSERRWCKISRLLKRKLRRISPKKPFWATCKETLRQTEKSEKDQNPFQRGEYAVMNQKMSKKYFRAIKA